MTPEITPEDREAAKLYLITKGGAYYRPKAEGYTRCIGEAGRFTLEDAIKYSHPNGSDGPRDGIRYELAPEASHHIAAEQRAQEAEPVAWMYSDDDDIVLHVERKPKGAYPYWTETPLYTHPSQADGDLTAAYLAGAASRNDEVRALQAEAGRLREALREARDALSAWRDYDDLDEPDFAQDEAMTHYANAINATRDTLTRIDAILAGEG